MILNTINTNSPNVGGQGAFWVTFTPVGDSSDIFDPDKTFEEVVAAINAGQIVMAKITMGTEETIILPLWGYVDSEEMGLTLFGASGALPDGSGAAYGIYMAKGQRPGGVVHSTLVSKSI